MVTAQFSSATRCMNRAFLRVDVPVKTGFKEAPMSRYLRLMIKTATATAVAERGACHMSTITN